ncbi:MAG: hypothetical protein R6V85_05005 [Polyangia bacterium]
MKGIRVRIDKRDARELRIGDFVSRKVAHGHLFKHVVRVCGLDRPELSSKVDKEQWKRAIDTPPLNPDLKARRKQALSALEQAGGCALFEEAPTTGSPCSGCRDAKQQQRVDEKLGDLLGAYRAVAQQAVRFAFENPNHSKPRLAAFHCDSAAGTLHRDHVRFKTIDTRGVCVVGVVQEDSAELALISCYRAKRAESYRAVWNDLSREMAGHRREGTSVDIEVASKEGVS